MANQTTYLKQNYPNVIAMCKHFKIPIETIRMHPTRNFARLSQTNETEHKNK